MDSSLLEFILQLYRCQGQRSYLSSGTFRNWQNKEKICIDLAARGLVDYNREISQVVLQPQGQELLDSGLQNANLSELESKVLQKVAKGSEGISPSKISISVQKKQLLAKERDEIIEQLNQRSLVSVITKIKRQKCAVWLTEKGKLCLDNVNEYFLEWQAATIRENTVLEHPSDSEILEIIANLDRELRTDNYLPIFHLRDKLQAIFTRDELDQALYRLQRQDKLEMSTLAEVKVYTPEQMKAGIPQPVGGPLFYLIIN
jgi:predicted transcriptional regulator